ncbi:crotonase/enoyl-CoA hydratase family protein [uncultured Algimonas sp.]|uniref:crotonase/enoyl-CoA hydratase family protein n=1 Tax=uncultured Algimonas sp. TaxID=1547920 RepID=UPI00260A4D8F|nr:crotonase/enoyl-CoA hydratase family protein [uncultured Algimonas sp.]
MTDLLTYELTDDVALIRLDDGKANAFSNAMFDAVGDALDRADADAKIIVLRGRDGIFSAGYNLKELMLGGQTAVDLVRRGSEFAVRMMETRKPVICAGDGHIVALGAFLFLAADYRIGRSSHSGGAFQVGLPETAKGLPMHNFGRELARPRLSQRHFSRAFINGEMFTPDEAVQVGYLDEAVDDVDAALAKAVAFFKGISLHAFAINKPRGHQTLLPVLRQAIEDDMDLKVG